MSRPKYWLIIFGCAMNYADGERVARILTELKFQPAEKLEAAELVVLVSCSVRQKAEDRVFGLLKNLTRWQAAKAGRQIFLTGCMVRPANQKKLEGKFPQLTAALPIKEIIRLPQILATPQVPLSPKDYLKIVPQRSQVFSALIPIMTGCDNFCSYCIVPYARGREVSRSQTEILRECRAAGQNGAREIFLLGQNVNSYGKKLGAFARLLRAACRLPKVERVRFTSSHPRDFDAATIATLAEEPKIERHVHLPAQHGSDKILARMNRGYTAANYLAKVEQLRKAVPEVSLTSDFIVGFPGETEADFRRLCQFYRQANFDFAFLASYSPRVGTPAAQLPRQVPEPVKRARLRRLNAILTKVTATKLKQRVGQMLQVLVEKTVRGVASGRSAENFLVKFAAQKNLLGQIVPVKITRAREFELWGEVI